MRVTIIPSDNRVSVEGISETIDCSSVLEMCADINVIQWYGDHGEIEYWNGPGSRIKMNTAFDDFEIFQHLVDAWEVEAQKPVEVIEAPANVA